jgi:hypothetical protein
MLLDQSANGNLHDLRDFSLTGTSTNLGGIAFGTSAYRSAFVYMRGIRVLNFSGTNAYGLSLNSVQELEGEDVWLQGNYNNIYHPNSGFVTSTVFSGAAGYNGNAVNCGVLFVGDTIFDISFKSGMVFESNTNEAIKAQGYQGDWLIDGCYFEDNGTDINLSGSSSAGQEINLQLLNSYFAISHTGGGKKLILDRTKRGTRIQGNRGLFKSGGVSTTANTVAHFADNSYGTDAVTTYRALSGTITWDETDTDGVRALGGASGGVRFSGSTPASSGATGKAGSVTWDASYIYICTAANTWKRAAIATW